MSRRARKWLLAIGIPLLLLLGGGAGLYLYLVTDIPPIDDSDLRTERDPVPPEENAAVVFWEAARKLRWPGDEPMEGDWTLETYPRDPRQPFDDEETLGYSPEPAEETSEEEEALGERLKEYAYGEGWGQAEVGALLARNEETINLWEQAVAKPQLQYPFPEVMGWEVPELFDMLALTRLRMLQARDLARKGEAGRALAMAAEIIRTGRRMSCAGHVLIGYLVGAMVQSMGADLVEDLVRLDGLDADTLKATAEEIGDCVPDGTALEDALAAEYVLLSNTIDGEIEKEKRGAFFFAYHPNRTRQAMAAYFREAIRAVHDMSPPAAIRARIEARRTDDCPPWRRPLERNAAGSLFLRELLPRLVDVVSSWKRPAVTLGVAQLQLALRAYQLDHGDLPETLDALVPAYLEAVPIDWCDGKPIRYDRARRILYSVGSDFVDDGGTSPEAYREDWARKNPDYAAEGFEPDIWEMPDPSWSLGF